jgi:hypothetical protein
VLFLEKIIFLSCYACNLYDIRIDLEGKTQIYYKGADFDQRKRKLRNFPVVETG